jgi:hypothetical protein
MTRWLAFLAVAVTVAFAAAAGPASAQPIAVRFPEQAPTLEARTVRLRSDTSVATGVDGAVRSTALLAEVMGRRGRWRYGLELGAIGWDDRYTLFNTHHARGLQPTNPIVSAAYWTRAAGTPLYLGFHVAAMLGLTGGMPCDCDGQSEYEKRPSQLTRFGALPITVPDESAGLLGLGARVDRGRWLAQAEVAIVGIAGDRGSASDTPNHGWFTLGGGVRVRDDLALSAHGLAHVGKRRYQPYESRFAVGGAAHLAMVGAVVSLRVDQRLDECYVGGWIPGDQAGTCTRVVLDYARGF